MARETTRAAAARHQITEPWAEATAVPTATGTTATGSVRGRAPASHRFIVSGKLAKVAALVAIDLPGGPAFVDALRRVVGRRRRRPAPRPAVVGGGPVRVAGRHGARRGGRPHRTDPAPPTGVPVEEGDALVVSTSGTTGRPRGVVLTHAAVTASALATSRRLGVDAARHRWLACLPLSHVGGLSVVTRALLTGAALTVHPGFDAGAVMAAAGPEVLVSLVPTTLARVEPGRFHTVVLGGSAPPAGLPANVVTTYGLTETGSGVVYDGVALDGVDVAVDAGGQIRLRGPMLLRAYRDGTVATDAEGWLRDGRRRLDSGGRPASRRRPALRSDHHRRRQRLARLRRSRPAPPPRSRSGRGRRSPRPGVGRAGRGMGRSRPRSRPTQARRASGSGQGSAGGLRRSPRAGPHRRPAHHVDRQGAPSGPALILRSALRDDSITLAPDAARAPAIALPIPLEAPVTSATFPSSRRSIPGS